MEIWKYEIPPKDSFTLNIPEGETILDIQTQVDPPNPLGIPPREQGVMWAMVDPEAEKKPRKFRLFGTGWTIPDDTEEKSLVYCGTFQTVQLGLVWHVFRVREWQ